MKIHPSAIVDPKARLGDDVEIGPFVCIGGEVEIGARCVVQSHAVLDGAVKLGADNRIGHGTIIGGWPQDLSFKAGTLSSVEIGDNNVIREHATIHRGTAEGSVTRLGNNNFLMAGAHVGHNCEIGNKVIIANNCLLGGHVTVDDGAFPRRRLRFPPIHAGRPARHHAGHFRFWERHSTILRRGRGE